MTADDGNEIRVRGTGNGFGIAFLVRSAPVGPQGERNLIEIQKKNAT